MTSSITRRGLLGDAAAGGIGIALSGSYEAVAGTRPSVGYGELVPDPAGILALPPGFSYRIVSEAGVTRMADGNPTPTDQDANGVFRRGNGSTIVNNYEIGSDEQPGGPAPPRADLRPRRPGRHHEHRGRRHRQAPH